MKIIKPILKAAAALGVSTLIMVLIIPVILDAADQEKQWQQDRLCRHYDVCESAGP